MGVAVLSKKVPKLKKPSGLPAGFTELVYIQSSGTQYVDSGFKPNQNTKLEIGLSGVTSGSYNITGCRNTASDATNRFGLIRYSATDKVGAFYGTQSATGPARDSALHHYILDANGMQVDGASYGSANTKAFSCTYPFLIGAWSNGSDGVQYNAMSVYYCRMYDNGTLVRDYVPCISNTDAVGLYDLVEGKFYGNAGTGVFIGSEVA